MSETTRIAILGGGPSGLFLFKRLVDTGRTDIHITLFERKNKLGSGMPYSTDGANDEHITNVSSNEIPMLVTPLHDWIKTVAKDTLIKYQIDIERFNEYKVLPRLLFGQYLSAQFDLLQKRAREKGIRYEVHYNSRVTDIIDHPEKNSVTVEVNEKEHFEFDRVVISTGHNWPRQHEGTIERYFDSPYPPSKLGLQLNHPVAIKGSSLTAVDAIRTLARHNGTFAKNSDNKITYQLEPSSADFKIVLHTRNGMLPAVRFHLDDSHLSNDALLTPEELKQHMADNDGFLSLDYVFENDFKLPIKDKDPEFFERIKDLTIEQFVEAMMALREQVDPFQLLKAEYAEAAKSIKRRESIYWKEMLGVLSFALNYPAKHLSAEDMQRLQKSLSPLISIVIAYIPQSSAEELISLHDAGVLSLTPVGEDSEVVPAETGGAVYHFTDQTGTKNASAFNTYVDCVGQPHLSCADLPFKSLLDNHTVSPAKLRFRSAEEGQKALNDGKTVTSDENGNYYLQVAGIAINDDFQIVDAYGALNERIYMMAVPYIGGYNPDYSGLDFSEEASKRIVTSMF